jgi:L-ascorbate metabolism protein UlaG (beta-lactamase superfamily)
MKITKFGQCCLLIKLERSAGVRKQSGQSNLTILTDPGMFSMAQNDIKGIDVLLITHEHADHYHVDSVKAIVKNNPRIKIITNTAVGKLLDKEKIAYSIVEHGGQTTEKGIVIEGFGNDHEEIYHGFVPDVQNTGYFIGGKLFYPGDAFYAPGKPVDILALPVAGPWTTVKMAIDYGLKVKPRLAFPVHDAMLTNPAMNHRVPQMVLEKNGIKFVALVIGKETEV